MAVKDSQYYINQTAIECLELIAENGSYGKVELDIFLKISKHFNIDISYIEMQNNIEMRKMK